MDSTKHQGAGSKTPAARDGARTVWHTFRRPAAAIAIIIVASLIPCMAILQNGVSDSASGRPDDIPVPVSRKWGQLEYTPVVIAPPLEFVPDMPAEYYSGDIVWYFTERGPAEPSNRFMAIDLSAPLREKLISMARPNESGGGMSIYPSRQLVLNLCLKDRSVLYVALNDDWRNMEQQNHFRFLGSSPDEWFAGSAVSPATRKLIEPLIYRHGEFMYFGDLRTTGYIPSRTERLNLVRTFLRSATFIAHLKVSADSDLEALVKYWGRGGRAGEVRPILEALMRKGDEQAINITHLLPALARRKLYTYPRPLGSEKEVDRRDCQWTAMNFFSEVSDDSSNSRNTVKNAAALKSRYYRIGGNLRLGDVVVLTDSRKNIVHCAVYIADDVFFHKCGSRSFTPWALTRRKHLEAYYPSHQKYKMRYYRPHDR
jgi:hypothetical protein